MKKWYSIIFEADADGLLLSMLVPINDINGGKFEYTQEVAIDGVAYDAVVKGFMPDDKKYIYFARVELYLFDDDKHIRDCHIVKTIEFEL